MDAIGPEHGHFTDIFEPNAKRACRWSPASHLFRMRYLVGRWGSKLHLSLLSLTGRRRYWPHTKPIVRNVRKNWPVQFGGPDRSVAAHDPVHCQAGGIARDLLAPELKGKGPGDPLCTLLAFIARCPP